ncbi:hypothetical protein [Alteromonas sp. NFXS44]|uniref:hypothetical protein n=1 Tax=Alteromonas sp. NFXS44 TaxID=2818435 RepID=UPI0032DF83C7
MSERVEGIQILSDRQSSLISLSVRNSGPHGAFMGGGGSYKQSGPKCVASRMPCHADAGCGGRQRFSPPVLAA